ncbi:DUF5673 domain-containing protein [Dethiothermospora halolimnae]|uniref:DUF5673 domain-containing protein n=1 Tax=Dethiothermospora halolimnae TaxID=3114390 RepID=UPI003CCBF152
MAYDIIYYLMLGIAYIVGPMVFSIVLIREIKLKSKLYDIENKARVNSIIFKINSNELLWVINFLIIGHLYFLYTDKSIFITCGAILSIILMIILDILYLTQNFYITEGGIICKYGFINWEDVISFEIEEGLDPFYKHYRLIIKYTNENGEDTERILNIRENKEKVNEIESILQKEIYDKKKD